MLEGIGKYIDHVIKTAKPTKLVLIAIDGVAPQAKISQQRRQANFNRLKSTAQVKLS